MHTLWKWRAKRAGGRITVYGTDADGNEAKVPNVDVIEPKEGRIIATVKDGGEVHLIL